MDRAPAKLPNTASRLIAMASMLVGSAHEVMAAMHASAENFRDYSAGTREPNWLELERLVTLIVSEQKKLIQANREAIARVHELRKR